MDLARSSLSVQSPPLLCVGGNERGRGVLDSSLLGIGSSGSSPEVDSGLENISYLQGFDGVFGEFPGG